MPFAELRRAFAALFKKSSATRDSRSEELQGSIDPYFIRRPARPLGDEVHEAERAAFDEAIFVARQQLDAAELLSNFPHRAESMHVLARALSAFEEAIGHLRRGLPAGVPVDELLPEALSQSLQVARQRLGSTPRLNAQLSDSDIRFWRSTLARARRLGAWLLTLGQRRRTVRARRAIRGAIFVAPLLLPLALFLGYSRLRDPFTVSASDFYASGQPNSPFQPEKAVDGDETTEWLTPENKDGWLELHLSPPRNVAAIGIVNARNAPFNDRGTKKLQIELFEKKQQVRRVEVKLEEGSTAEQRITAEGKQITRVRLTARGHYGHGAGLAEVRVFEK